MTIRYYLNFYSRDFILFFNIQYLFEKILHTRIFQIHSYNYEFLRTAYTFSDNIWCPSTEYTHDKSILSNKNPNISTQSPKLLFNESIVSPPLNSKWITGWHFLLNLNENPTQSIRPSSHTTWRSPRIVDSWPRQMRFSEIRISIPFPKNVPNNS